MGKQLRVGLYARLSVAGRSSADESMSIRNQKELLRAYAETKGWDVVKAYVDDGCSGSDFTRPGFREMLKDARSGAINLILVKDLSRFGRNYIEVGRYIEQVLPSLGCRFVAISDGVDSPDNELAPFLNLLNDTYLQDLSRKIKTSLRSKAQAGKRIGGRPPYGYQAGSDGLVVDAYAAGHVRWIYEMRRTGAGYARIARALNERRILPPGEYAYGTEGRGCAKEQRSVWMPGTVKKILCNECYAGRLVQLRHGTLSYRTRRIVTKPQEEWVRIENAHGAIIDPDVWNDVQAVNAQAGSGYTDIPAGTSLFRGLLRCAGCGSAMRIHRANRKAHAIYRCPRTQAGAASCVGIFIKEEALMRIIGDELPGLFGAVAVDREKIRTELEKVWSESVPGSTEKALKRLQADIAGVERKIGGLFEGRVSRALPEKTFAELIGACGAELEEKRLTLQALHTERSAYHELDWTAYMPEYFADLHIDRKLLREMIGRIEVGRASAAVGGETQEVKIFYKTNKQA